ncbi:Mis12 protein-domain-containing protein [Microdochium bolleyi]|uniref:Mis12 protein-domain-containing protein n=1 Tax=Microdochium bolleyi TaxID=196109 RepID=A0A136JAT2_9PEZI|nr:Mis12 protein-domain-containing protein [Microdochium bolleyi]
MADTELLTEHFGYPPVSLLDDIINSVNILAERALNSVEQGLLNAPPASLGFKSKPPPKYTATTDQPWNPAEAAKAEIEAGTHQLETLLCASIDRNLDKFELFVLRNFLCVQPVDIRDWMRLSHYDGLDFLDAAVAHDVAAAASQKSDVPTLDSINELRRKLRESMRLNALLTAERERNARTLQKLQHLVLGGAQIKTEGDGDAGTAAPGPAAGESKEKHGPSPFAFLQQKGTLSAADRSAPLATTTAFTLSQLQALRALSESLRNVTPDLSTPTPPDDDDDDDEDDDEQDNAGERKPTGILNEEKYRSKSWRRQRTEYVEHATRRHLEIVHGLELGRHGEVRDGEWQGEGRQLAHGEVEGLERVAAILGREAEEMAAKDDDAGREAGRI